MYSGMCIDSLGNNKIAGKVGMYTCHGLGGNQVSLHLTIFVELCQ